MPIIQLGRRRWQTTHILEELGHLKKWINRIGTDGNSDDESDVEDESEPIPRIPKPTYWIVPLPWRSRQLVNLLRALDTLHLSTRFTQEGKPTPGQWPRVRKTRPTSRITYSVEAVPALPRCFYDEHWLATRTPWELEMLRIREVNVDLSIPRSAQE
jgi:hypothetical protein